MTTAGNTARTDDERSPRVTTAQNIAWNYAGHVYSLAINFGLTYYLVRYLNISEYGLFLFITSLSATLYLLDMGLSSILVQSYVAALLHSDKSRLSALFSTAFVALSVFGSIGALILVGLSFALPGPFKVPPQYIQSASIILVISAALIQIGLPSIALEQIYQASNRFDRINQSRLISSTLQLLLTIGVLATGFGIVGLASVQLVSAVIQILLLFIGLRRSVPKIQLRIAHFRWSLLRELTALSKWAFLNNISSYILELFGWAILGSLGSMREAALYGLATKLPKQLWNLVDKGTGITLPSLSECYLNNDIRSLQRSYLRSQKFVVGAVLPFILLGCIFAGPIINVWAGPTYAQATPVMQWLLLAALSHAMLYSSDLLLYACGRVREAAWISAAGGAISLIGSVLLVPRFGAAGMASSIAVSQLFVCCSWFTVEACRISKVSLNVLLRNLLNGLGLPVLAMAFAVVISLSIRSLLSPFWLVICGVVSGSLYLGVWGFRTALPLARNEIEVSE